MAIIVVKRSKASREDPAKQVSHPCEKPIMFVSAGWCKMSAKSNGPKWPHRVLWLAIFIVALAAIVARPGNAGPKGDTTGTVSKAEPPVRQDGTPAHPYADASQCPSSTDVVIWPRDRAEYTSGHAPDL